MAGDSCLCSWEGTYVPRVCVDTRETTIRVFRHSVVKMELQHVSITQARDLREVWKGHGGIENQESYVFVLHSNRVLFSLKVPGMPLCH